MSDSNFDDWTSVPSDPRPSDLGYELLPLDMTESSAAGGHLVVLPEDEEYLHEEAFIIANADIAVDLENNR
jgi:hypothetical protein